MFNNNIYINNDTDEFTFDKLPEFDYNSFYRATVVSNSDPENLGRIKVRIPALHQDATTYELPYAYPAIFAGLGYQTGQFILPPIGSVVFVTFEYSSEHRIIYFGGIPTKYAQGKEQYFGTHINNGEPVLVTSDDIPTEFNGTEYIIYKSPSGSIIYIDDDSKCPKLVLRDSLGQKIVFNSNDINQQEANGDIIIQHDEDNLIKISNDGIVLRVAGEDYTAPFGGGGSGSGTAKTVLWD